MYYTAQITPDDEGESFRFRMKFSGSGTRTVEFIPYWGEYRTGIILEGEEIKNGYAISGNDVVSGNY